MLTFFWLSSGALLGALYATYGRSKPRGSKAIFGWGLIVAAAAYFVFLADASDLAFWVILESIGLALFGAIAFLGMNGSSWWLAAGWAAHPAWDVGLRHFGTDAGAPTWYALGCVSFDWVVAASIAFGLLRSRTATKG
jgi:hypothetical protein